MKKTGIFAWIFTATLFSVSPLTSLPAKAEGGCPKGLFPVGGGYCRNIVCVEGSFDSSTVPIMKKYGALCPGRETRVALYEALTTAGGGKIDPDAKYFGGSWGNMMVPMR